MSKHFTPPTAAAPPPLHPDDETPPTDPVTPLLNGLFAQARPIADACREPGLDMAVSDPAPFFAGIAALETLGYDGIEPTLLMFLDEFCQLEQRSYDELYLWSIVELSRRNLDHVDAFWPLALTLDLRFRAANWQRPTGTLLEQPYRLTELVMYHYVLATRPPAFDLDALPDEANSPAPRRYPPLATCLRRFYRQLTEVQAALLLDTLRELARQERQPAFGDAHGCLLEDIRKARRLAADGSAPV